MRTFFGAGYWTWRADTANSFLDKTRAIIQEILCPPTYSPCFIMTR